MNVLVVDDEPYLMENCKETAMSFDFIKSVVAFTSPTKALQYASSPMNHINIAILDIEMPGMSGLELAEKLHLIDPNTFIIFLTSYSQYALDAFSVNAIDYLLKPFSRDDMERSLKKVLRLSGLNEPDYPIVSIHTFDGFEVYVDGKILHFPRKKSKELLALLVDRRGSSITNAEAIACLWEDTPASPRIKENFKKCSYVLKKLLKDNNILHIINDNYNSLSLNIGTVICDYYQFLQRDESVMCLYHGSYMCEYSWAEETNGLLYSMSNF